jgi:hypothetical protein
MIEVRHEPGLATLVRDSEVPHRFLSFEFTDWRDFVVAAKRDQFDLPGCAVLVREFPGGVHLISHRRHPDGLDLVCDSLLWSEFLAGVKDGDFDREDLVPRPGDEIWQFRPSDVLIPA